MIIKENQIIRFYEEKLKENRSINESLKELKDKFIPSPHQQLHMDYLKAEEVRLHNLLLELRNIPVAHG